MTRKTFGKKSLDTFIFVSPRVKSANHPFGLSSAKLCPWPNATDVVYDQGFSAVRLYFYTEASREKHNIETSISMIK